MGTAGEDEECTPGFRTDLESSMKQGRCESVGVIRGVICYHIKRWVRPSISKIKPAGGSPWAPRNTYLHSLHVAYRLWFSSFSRWIKEKESQQFRFQKTLCVPPIRSSKQLAAGNDGTKKQCSSSASSGRDGKGFRGALPLQMEGGLGGCSQDADGGINGWRCRHCTVVHEAPCTEKPIPSFWVKVQPSTKNYQKENSHPQQTMIQRGAYSQHWNDTEERTWMNSFNDSQRTDWFDFF